MKATTGSATLSALGIDLGNGKVKLCYVEGSASRPKVILWTSEPLPFTSNRVHDFAHGLQAAVASFRAQHELNPVHAGVVAVATSNLYSFKTFAEAARVTAKLVPSSLRRAEIDFVDAAGELHRADSIATRADPDLGRFAATNFFGAAFLGAQLLPHGVSVDVGTTSTEIVPVADGEIDACALAAPAAYLEHRYAESKLLWLGCSATPLSALSRTVRLRGKRWPVIPRGAWTEVVTVHLGLVPAKELREHAYRGLVPTRAEAAHQLAQSVGLDPQILAREEIDAIATELHEAMVLQIADAIRRNVGKPARGLRAAVHGLGAEAVARPALLRAGFTNEQIARLQLRGFRSVHPAASAYGLALRGLTAQGSIDLRGYVGTGA